MSAVKKANLFDEPETTEPKAIATIGEVVQAKRAERDIPREVEVENFVRRLPCKLNPEDVASKLREIKSLAVVINHEKEVNAQLKMDFETAKKEFEGAKSNCESRINQSTQAREELISQTCDGVEYRDTQCQRVRDYQNISVSEYRIDTKPKELLQQPRPMTSAELQMPTLDKLSPKDIVTALAKTFEQVSTKSLVDNNEAEPEDDDGIIDDAVDIASLEGNNEGPEW
jgi:hypothetical protein